MTPRDLDDELAQDRARRALPKRLANVPLALAAYDPSRSVEADPLMSRTHVPLRRPGRPRRRP